MLGDLISAGLVAYMPSLPFPDPCGATLGPNMSQVLFFEFCECMFLFVFAWGNDLSLLNLQFRQTS